MLPVAPMDLELVTGNQETIYLSLFRNEDIEVEVGINAIRGQ
jgi:hypothetical protein